MTDCLITECHVVISWIRFFVFYVMSFCLILTIPYVIFAAMTKASFVFYKLWKCIHERNDSLKPTFKNARKLAQVTWSEFFYAQRQIERARVELNKELNIIESIRRRIQEDLKGLPSLNDKKQVFFVESHKARSNSNSSSAGGSSIGLSTTC